MTLTSTIAKMPPRWEATSEDPPGPWDRIAQRLATAHLVASTLAAVAAIATVASWPEIRAGGQPLEIDAQAKFMIWGSLAYFMIASLTELRSGVVLHGTGWPADRLQLVRWLPPLMVALASLVVLSRGEHSLALLAGMDVILALVMSVSLLQVGIAMVEWRTLGQREPEWVVVSDARWSLSAHELGWTGLQWCAMLLFVLALVHLELQPVPHGWPASPADQWIPPAERNDASS